MLKWSENCSQGFMLVFLVAYIAFLTYTCYRILIDTKTTSKALAYLILIVAFPLVGLIVYYSFGINFRKIRHYRRELTIQRGIDSDYKAIAPNGLLLPKGIEQTEGKHWEAMMKFSQKLGGERISLNKIQLLINGESKFPELIACLEKAEHFIHMEYYAWENDIRGNQIKDALIDKSKQGVKVRVLYDDYASRKIRSNVIRDMRNAGVAVVPKIKVKFKQLANRLNHRDHRKLVIIDGSICFIGGINISDRYDNSIDTGLYWRDTHIKVSGPHANDLNRHFLVSWNASVDESHQLKFSQELLGSATIEQASGNESYAHAVAGGPIYPMSPIMLSYSKLFSMAREKLYISNPYFIPKESILENLKASALSGVDVRIMVPEVSDSLIVAYSSKYFFDELLEAGVRIFLYKKGFVHAKTVVADSYVSVVGTANMDIRSFDLNFEIMTFAYGSALALELENAFLNDLNECTEVPKDFWQNQSILEKLKCTVARLISSFL